MGLFSFFFKKPARRENEFFGTLLLSVNKKDPRKCYFEGTRLFYPSATTIEISMDGWTESSLQPQIDFFKSIEDNYPLIISVVSPLIENEFRNWKPGFKIMDFEKEFKPVHLSLPDCESSPVVWEIAFETEHDRDHSILLTMADFEATAILIDG